MLRAIITIWPLFLGIALIQSGNGLQASLLGVRASLEEFGTFTTGIVISGYYWGFLIGSQLGPKLVQQVGHVRVFGAFSASAFRGFEIAFFISPKMCFLPSKA